MYTVYSYYFCQNWCRIYSTFYSSQNLILWLKQDIYTKCVKN